MTDTTKPAAAEPQSLRRLTLDDLWHFARIGVLPSLNWQQSILAIRDTHHWRTWLTRILLVLGAAHILAGLIFFFAYNWADLTKTMKFGLLFAAIASSCGLWWLLGPDKRSGELMGTAATVFTGVLMAVFGQIYQTGADAHELFVAWAALTLPWAIISKSPVHLLVWIIIGDTAYGLYAAQVMHPVWGISGAVLFAVNAAGLGFALVALKQASSKRPYLNVWWLEGTLIFAVAAHMAFAGWDAASNFGITTKAPDAAAGLELSAVIILQLTLIWGFMKAACNLLGSILALAAITSTLTFYLMLEVSNAISSSGASLLLSMSLIVAAASALFIYAAKKITATLRAAQAEDGEAA